MSTTDAESEPWKKGLRGQLMGAAPRLTFRLPHRCLKLAALNAKTDNKNFVDFALTLYT